MRKLLLAIMLLALATPALAQTTTVMVGENGVERTTVSTQTGGVNTIASGGTNATSATAGTVPNATSATASSWTATPTLGVDNTTAGTLQLANGSSNAHLIIASGATTSWTFTPPATAPAQGSVMVASNGTGTFAASITPTLGVAGTSSGTLTLANATGAGTFTLASAATTTTYTLTAPATAPGTSGMVLSSTTAGAGSWLATEGSISAGSNIYGNTTSYPTNTVIVSHKATNAGHFTQLNSVNNGLAGGSCTTAPTFNVFDGTSNTGTAATASTTAQTKGNQTSQAQSQTFAAGDVIGIYVSTQGGTCTAPLFTAEATVTYP